jgi:hypothetical protein
VPAAPAARSTASPRRIRSLGGRGRNELRKELVELGALVPVDVEGVRGKRFVLGEELALLQAPPEPAPSVAFIAPFDSLLWDNALVASLFGFEYLWEGFFPPAKRRWGWYVLPICFGDRFVGRIEPRIDRDRARVEVLGVWWEDGFAPRRADGFARRCATRSARTCASRARAACNGHPTWPRRSGSSPPARDRPEWSGACPATLAACPITTVRPAGSPATCSTSWWPS